MSRYPWPEHVSNSLCQVKLYSNEPWHCAHGCSFLVHRALRPCAMHSPHGPKSVVLLVPHQTMALRPWFLQLACCTRLRCPCASVGKRWVASGLVRLRPQGAHHTCHGAHVCALECRLCGLGTPKSCHGAPLVQSRPSLGAPLINLPPPP